MSLPEYERISEMSEEQEKEKMTPEKYAVLLNKEFEDRKKQWNAELPPLFSRLKADPEELPDLQADLLSKRHMLTDELAFLNSQIAKQNKRLRKQRRDKYVFYSTGVMPDGTRPNGRVAARDIMISQLKTSKGEKDLVIAGDLTDYELAAEILESHVSFLRDCLKSIDHALYAIKNRIDLLNIFAGVK